MHGVNLLYKIGLDGFETARLAQIVENHIVGAPCGILMLLVIWAYLRKLDAAMRRTRRAV